MYLLAEDVEYADRYLRNEGSPLGEERDIADFSAQKTFDDAVGRDVSKTNRRRSSNRGIRRFRHLMKRGEFSRRFWVISAVLLIVMLGFLLAWELFFHYPKPESDYTDDVYRAVVE